MTTINLRKGESIDRALKRLKRQIDREGTIVEVRARRAYVKPSEKKRLRLNKAKFEQMLRTRREL